jgi:ribose 5-phosphate isomerase RpiB
VLTGVITASRLAGLEGTIYLAAGAKLSPLAVDLVKQRGLQIQTISAAPKPATTTSWIYWMQGHCPSAARAIEQLRGKAVADVRTAASQQLPAVIRAVAKEFAGGQTRLAVLFVPSAARAVCLANRCANLRAIVGTCRQAVQEGIELLGANVLVLEYPHHGFKSMDELVRLFLTSSGRAPKDVESQLTELAACG